MDPGRFGKGTSRLAAVAALASGVAGLVFAQEAILEFRHATGFWDTALTLIGLAWKFILYALGGVMLVFVAAWIMEGYLFDDPRPPIERWSMRIMMLGFIAMPFAGALGWWWAEFLVQPAMGVAAEFFADRLASATMLLLVAVACRYGIPLIGAVVTAFALLILALWVIAKLDAGPMGQSERNRLGRGT